MEHILEVESLSKRYRSVQALKEVSFAVPPGSVFGILGPNGSGKTTLLGIVMDVLRADKGNFKWFGSPGSEASLRRKIGCILETPNFYGYLSGTDNLRITQAISGRGNKKDIDEVLKKVKLYDRRWASFKSFSLGMKQRLAIGAALLGNPRVLVLDEPTNGLDPVGIAEIRNLISDLNKQGHTIIMASHLLDEVEKVCTHTAILKNGQLVASGSVEEILMDEDILELGAENMTQLENILLEMGLSVQVQEKGLALHISFPKGTARPAEINRLCHDRGVVLNKLTLLKKRLEARFFELTGGVQN